MLYRSIPTIVFAMTLVVAVRAGATLRIVATTADLAAIATSVAGEDATVTSLARPGEDPHFVDAKPSYVRVLNQADVLIEGGAGLEAGWLTPLVDGARNPKVAPGAPGRILANEGIAMRDVPSQLDRALGDVHPFGNPHYLLDPDNAKIVARTIAHGLCEADAAGCATYERQRDTFTQQLTEKLSAWQQTLAAARGSKLVTYHRSFDYFAGRFGLDVLDTLEPKPGIPPSPTHLASLVPEMQAAHARLIVIESFRDPKSAELVAEKTGARVLRVPLMPGGPDARTYTDLLDLLVGQIAEALR